MGACRVAPSAHDWRSHADEKEDEAQGEEEDCQISRTQEVVRETREAEVGECSEAQASTSSGEAQKAPRRADQEPVAAKALVGQSGQGPGGLSHLAGGPRRL